MNAHEALRAYLALRRLDEWLAAHPRGQVELLPDENGRICHLTAFDLDQADQAADATGWGKDSLAAVSAALGE